MRRAPVPLTQRDLRDLTAPRDRQAAEELVQRLRVGEAEFVVAVEDRQSFVVDLFADAEDGEPVGSAGGLWPQILLGRDEEVAVDHVADLGGKAEEHFFRVLGGIFRRMLFVLGRLDRRKAAF